MASTIKGITVKIAGDTIDLQKSLKAVQSSSSSLQSELSAVNRQLKFDPENTVLLAQKQEVLKEQIENSKSALKKLLDVQDQVEEQAKNGEISTEQYRAYQREVEKAKSKLDSFGEQLDKTRDKFDKVTNGIENLENKSNTTDLSKVKKEMDDVKSSADNLKSAVGDTLKEAGAAATAVGGALTGAVISANSEEKALNSLQAQTGLTTEELSKYESIIGEIYKDNFGESQEDIANTLSKIKQVTDEQDPQKLKDMAENLYTLEGTFDNFDISETLRGINGLITNMGLTADEAFDYIVKGAQNGLNYSGELGDNIAEYSQVWGQAGFDAEQMFSILENGTKNGAYNLDNVNDFVKEFTISLSDGRIEKNLGSFSKGTGEIFKKWKDGKATASDVFYSVISDLKNTKNEQKALTTASTVWSALGEDNAMKVIKSLGNVNKNYKNVKGSMEKIKDIKYDDIESDWASLGRTVQTDVINPIGKSLFPEVKKLCKFVENHTDDIIPTLKQIGVLTTAIWSGKKATKIVTEIKNLWGAYKSLRAATDAAKISQEGLNTAQKANLWGLVAGLVVGAIGEIWAFSEANDSAKQSQEELNEAQEKAKEEIKELKDANDEYVQSKKDAASEVESEFQYYDDLWVELQGIVDKNGEVKKGYEDRAQFITNELSRVTGNEITWNGNVIQSYKDLKSSMDDALESKKALALLSATEDSYQTAVSGLAGAKTDSVNQYAIVRENKNDVSKARDSVNSLQMHDTKAENVAWWAYENKNIDKHTLGVISANAKGEKVDKEELDVAQSRIKALETAYDQELENRKNVLSQKESVLKDAEAKYKTYQDKIVNYNTTIKNFENLTAANAKGNAEEIKAAMSDVENSLITHTTGTKDTLEQQVNDFKTNAENLRTAYKDGVEGVTKDQVEEAEELQERAEIELAKYTDMYGTVAAIATGKADEINAQQQKIKNGFIDAETGSRESLENQLANFTANYELLKTAMDENQPGVTQKMVDNAKELVDKATVELNKLEPNSEEAGKGIPEGTSKGTKDKDANKKVDDSCKSLVNRIFDNFSGVYDKFYEEGKNLVQGYMDGAGSLTDKLFKSAGGLAELSLSAIQKTQDSHSPARKSRKLGQDLGRGYPLGIKDEIGEAEKAARSMSSRTLSALEGDPIRAINGKFANIRTQSQNAAVNGQMLKTVTNSPTIEIQFTGDVNINNDMDVDDFNRRVSTAIVQTLDGEASKLGG
jgi:phage-related minor tail protein|nr:MAG: minor tail protein [Bacteriophage sp.]DAF06318.1 MAG TPA: minor tail protein [Caudoviricetes sp.]